MPRPRWGAAERRWGVAVRRRALRGTAGRLCLRARIGGVLWCLVAFGVVLWGLVVFVRMVAYCRFLVAFGGFLVWFWHSDPPVEEDCPRVVFVGRFMGLTSFL